MNLNLLGVVGVSCSSSSSKKFVVVAVVAVAFVATATTALTLDFGAGNDLDLGEGILEARRRSQRDNAMKKLGHSKTSVTLFYGREEDVGMDMPGNAPIAETSVLPEAEVLLDEVYSNNCTLGSCFHRTEVTNRIGNRSKRSPPAAASAGCQQEVHIELFDRQMSLCLTNRPFALEDAFREFYREMNVTLYGEGSEKTSIPLDSLDLSYVSGYVRGEEFSGVDGFMMDGMFYGSIYINEGIFYVDPVKGANQSFTMFNDPEETLVDPGTGNLVNQIRLDIHTTKGSGEKKPDKNAAISSIRAFMAKYRKLRFGGGAKEPREKRSPDAESEESAKGQRRSCDVAVVIDHLFFHEVGMSNLKRTLLQVFWLLKESNGLLNSKDFDDDGRSELLSINIAAVTILTSKEATINILDGYYATPEDFLKEFSRYNFSNYCLGMLFTNRVFDDLVLGLSWRGNPIPGGVGGVCQTLARYKADGKTYSFNALFVSMRSQQQARIPLRMAVLNLVHELLHSFGAKHDPPALDDPICTPRDSMQNGRYLMSRFSNNGRRLNHEVLSACTKRAVVDVLRAEHRTTCLRYVNTPFCGDGVVQPGEDCDCGTIYACLKEKANCFPPSGGPSPAAGCTFRQPWKQLSNNRHLHSAKQSNPDVTVTPLGGSDGLTGSTLGSSGGQSGLPRRILGETRVKQLMDKFNQILKQKYGKRPRKLDHLARKRHVEGNGETKRKK